MRLVHLPILCLLLSACGNTPTKSLDQLRWLEGVWVMPAEPVDEYTLETWKMAGKDELAGSGLTLLGQDTLFAETLRIVRDGDNIFYIADVGEGPVRFRLTETKSSRWTFSNPQHDFPKEIIYHKQGDAMTVLVRAQERTQEYQFKKLKNGFEDLPK